MFNSRRNPKALSPKVAPSAGLAHRTLYVIPPRQLPGWTVYFTSSHSKKKTVRWLISKGFSNRLNKAELEILITTLLSSPEWLWEVGIFLYENNSNPGAKRWVQREGKEFFSKAKIDPSYRTYRSYTPELSIFKVWTKKISLPELPFVGVGYNDKGNMGSALAWQDQMVTQSEELDLNELANLLFTTSSQVRASSLEIGSKLLL